MNSVTLSPSCMATRGIKTAGSGTRRRVTGGACGVPVTDKPRRGAPTRPEREKPVAEPIYDW